MNQNHKIQTQRTVPQFQQALFGLAFFWILWMMALPLCGQSFPISIGSQLPSNPDPTGEWFLDTCTHQARYFKGKYWKEIVPDRVDSIWRCGDLVILVGHNATYNLGARIFRIIPFHDQTKNTLVMTAAQVFCGNKVLVYQTLTDKRPSFGTWIRVLHNDPAGRKDGPLAMSFETLCDTMQIDTVLQNAAICVPQYFEDEQLYKTVECVDFRNWGMLDGDGNWVITPQYDAPFHFKNGIAEVIYYGQKRKINEKGEFVE